MGLRAYFYGFVGGDASQWQPNLFRNTTPIYPFQGNPGWNLTTAMADGAIQYIRPLKALARRSRSSCTTCRAARMRAPPDAGMDQEDRRHELFQRRLGEAAQPSSPTRSGSVSCRSAS